MPMPGYLSVTGQTQGNIEGGCVMTQPREPMRY
jgi:type VI protein secretion system component Hcp